MAHIRDERIFLLDSKQPVIGYSSYLITGCNCMEGRMRYKIQYNGKEYVSTGASAQEAWEKWANVPLFGGGARIGCYRLKMIDADTCGQQWATYNAGWPSSNQYHVMVEVI